MKKTLNNSVPMTAQEVRAGANWLRDHWDETAPVGIYSDADRLAAREALGEERIKAFVAGLMEGLEDDQSKLHPAG